MGRLVDADKLLKNQYRIDDSATLSTRDVVNVEDIEDATNTVEAIPKADYENRLKADLVAMLTEIQLEIEEIKPLKPTDDEDWQYGCFHGLTLMQDMCLRLIQQKINSLKEK